MGDTVENKRAGRDKELRGKIKSALDRYEAVFGKPLSTEVLHEFLDESEKNNRIQFLKDRVGVLSDQDVKYLRELLDENKGSPETELTVADDDLDEISESDLENLSA